MRIIEFDEDKVFKYVDEWNNFKGYIPLILHRYIDSEYYFKNTSEESRLLFYKSREGLQYTYKYKEYLYDELDKWLNENSKYKDIIKIDVEI